MPATMAVADALVDFKFARSIRDEKKRKPKNKGKRESPKTKAKISSKRKTRKTMIRRRKMGV